jgi:GntR family transcriptional regulator
MLIAIDPDDPRPVYQQIAVAVKQQVRTGQLSPGDELPGVRELAAALQINLHTVRHAYRLLSEQGVVRMGLGRRTRVLKPDSPKDPQQVMKSLLPRVEEWVADAEQRGLSAKEIRRLVDRALVPTDKKRKKA